MRQRQLPDVLKLCVLGAILLGVLLWSTGASAENVTAIDGGGEHTCAVTAGVIKCWGSNTEGALGNGDPPPPDYRTSPGGVCADTSCSSLLSDVTDIAVGADNVNRGHTCALITLGGVKCWGFNLRGQLGDGTTTTRTTPVDVSGLSAGAFGIDAGGDHTCALVDVAAAQNYGVKCWGRNSSGQLGAETSETCGPEPFDCSTVPVDVCGAAPCTNLVGASAVDLLGDHTCALMQDTGGVKCWGANSYGELGNGTTVQSVTPVDVCATGASAPCGSSLLSGASDIASGVYHTCALVGGGVKCWGWNSCGQLGNGEVGDTFCSPGHFDHDKWTPVDVCAEAGCGSLLSGATDVSAGFAHTCAVVSGGVKCWGWNGYGQLGNDCGDPYDRCSLPEDVVDELGKPLTNVTAVAAGFNHTCALLDSGSLKCWGYNDEGQLGDTTTTTRTSPVDVFGLIAPTDSDLDGCTNGQEQGSDPGLGGLRDAKYFWDFWDTPPRDRAITLVDIFAVNGRFGATGDPNIDPLSSPPAAPAYHPAFDRGTQIGPNSWNRAPADGSITTSDIFAIADQFGHTCA